jgi:glycosyltransferase involved in cell wall biosynthesis
MANNRLVYLYVSNGSADVNQIPKWYSNLQTQEPFAHHFQDEGFCFLFHKLLDNKIFDEILVVIESNRSPGSLQLRPNMKILVVPHINNLKPFLRDTDILWARGGWRSWFPFLQEWHDYDRWLLFYRAASNRGAWEFWDIVLDDLITECDQDAIGRFYYPINKPIHPDVFFPMEIPRKYDLMIGASHIHDKKGQFKMIPILIEYRKRYDTNLKCIMPGGMKRGIGTSSIEAAIDRFDLDITVTGMVPRSTLSTYYNQSKLFVHCGGAGQNDRGPLEAMSCGTPVMLAMEQYHAPCIRSDNTAMSFHITPDEPALAVQQINHAMKLIDENFHSATHRYYQSVNGIDEVVYPRFAALFRRILNTSHTYRQGWFDDLLGKSRRKNVTETSNDKNNLS